MAPPYNQTERKRIPKNQRRRRSRKMKKVRTITLKLNFKASKSIFRALITTVKRKTSLNLYLKACMKTSTAFFLASFHRLRRWLALSSFSSMNFSFATPPSWRQSSKRVAHNLHTLRKWSTKILNFQNESKTYSVAPKTLITNAGQPELLSWVKESKIPINWF